MQSPPVGSEIISTIHRTPLGLTYHVLEVLEILLSHGIGLGNDWNQIDSGAQSLHDLNIERFDTALSLSLDSDLEA